MESSVTYVVCWDDVFDNTAYIEDQLTEGGFDYRIINKSSYLTESPNWIKANDTRYYGHFLDAITHFIEKTDKKIFIFNAGDSRWPDIKGYTERLEGLFSKDPLIGVISPDQTNDPFTGSGSHIKDSTQHPGLYLATLTNGIFVAIKRDIAQIMYEYMKWAGSHGVSFYTMTSGWGLDYLYAAATYMFDKKVYKDSKVKMNHPDGSGYNYDIAAKESDIVMKSFIDFWAETRPDSHKVRALFSVFMRKVHEKDSYKVLLKEVYLNGRQPAEV